MASPPFVVGQWVRGEKFYGRETLIHEILDGHRNWLWLLGTRRVGKTSLLKQVELVTTQSPGLGYFPLFWDFQGADTSQELHEGFADALLDAEERLEALDIDPADVEHEDLFRSLNKLRRQLRPKGMRALLLCDEVEELIKLNQKDPSLLRKLRRAMQSQEDVRSVLASTIRLWALADQEGEDTSPFLHGFTPPLYIHALSDDEARQLICQANLESDSRPRFDGAAIEKIRDHCDNHPYLLQLICKRYLDLGDLDEAIEEVATDPMVSYFFAVDFEMLSATERNIIRLVSERTSSTSDTIQSRFPEESDYMSGVLLRLEHLGFIRRNTERRFVLPNYFFRRWFRENPERRRISGISAPPTPRNQLPTDGTTLTEIIRLGPFDSRYELVELVGEGASGIVYKAFDTLLRSHLAVKVLKPDFSRSPEAFERFRQEILLSQEIRHPNVLTVNHLGEFEEKKYLTMKWVDGPTLGNLISREAPFSLERTKTIATKIADALQALHAESVLHRDIKPHNILIDNASGEPQLTDFGLARLVGQPGMTSVGVFLGTPNYASPEQACLMPLDERSDLYSLGLVIFEMCTGKLPFVGTSERSVLDMHRNDTPPSPRDLNPEVPEALAELILCCLEKEPDKRFAKAGELREALRRIECPA